MKQWITYIILGALITSALLIIFQLTWNVLYGVYL